MAFRMITNNLVETD